MKFFQSPSLCFNGASELPAPLDNNMWLCRGELAPPVCQAQVNVLHCTSAKIDSLGALALFFWMQSGAVAKEDVDAHILQVVDLLSASLHLAPQSTMSTPHSGQVGALALCGGKLASPAHSAQVNALPCTSANLDLLGALALFFLSTWAKKHKSECINFEINLCQRRHFVSSSSLSHGGERRMMRLQGFPFGHCANVRTVHPLNESHQKI